MAIVSSSDFATRLGRALTTEEAVKVTAFITDAIAVLEGSLYARNMTISTATYTDMYLEGDGRSKILWVGHSHITGITDITDVSDNVIPATSYMIAPCGCFIERLNGDVWGSQYYKVTFTAGYADGDVPAALKHVILSAVSTLWNKFGAAGLSSVSGLSVAYSFQDVKDALLNDPSLSRVLSKYKCKQIVI